MSSLSSNAVKPPLFYPLKKRDEATNWGVNMFQFGEHSTMLRALMCHYRLKQNCHVTHPLTRARPRFRSPQATFPNYQTSCCAIPKCCRLNVRESPPRVLLFDIDADRTKQAWLTRCHPHLQSLGISCLSIRHMPASTFGCSFMPGKKKPLP